MKKAIRIIIRRMVTLPLVIIVVSMMGTYAHAALTAISDEPAASAVPANVMLDLSVEWPTAVIAAYNDNQGPLPYVDSSGVSQTKQCPGRDESLTPVFVGLCYFDQVTYYGYFDPYKCYDYDKSIVSSTLEGTRGAFVPRGATNSLHECNNGKWSGNYLNWTTTQPIDGFRWVLSGGHRSVDTSNMTILEKARQTGQGGFYDGFPVKRVGGSVFSNGAGSVTPVHPRTVTPYFNSGSGKPALYVKLEKWYWTPLDDPFGSPAGSGGFLMQVSSSKDFPTPATSPDFTDTYYVRVRVCDPSAPPAYGANSGLEANCTKYGSIYKPSGLIQQNSLTMRFGVFSYLLDSAIERAGGVLRARMKDAGPQKYIPGTGQVNNPRTEWSASDGTFINNPEPGDASGSGVPNSGVINYLNKFGRKGYEYKVYDPPAELFYESLRYLRNLSPTAEYIKNISAPMKDDFPAITQGWDDPIQYSCQKNFVIFIGDSNINCDSLVPGNGLKDTCNGHSGGPSAGDPAINARNLSNKVGALEGMGNLGDVEFPKDDPSWPRPANYPPFRKATYNISGLAYWANTNDIRPDVSNKPQTTGKQTVQSFFVDVMQDFSPRGKNIYWLGAKYGGFDDINNDGTPANSTTWDKNGDGVPDNYFEGAQPDKLSKSLTKIFASITGSIAAAAGAGIINYNFDTSSIGNSAYQTLYKTSEWSGDVEGGTLLIKDTPALSSTFTKSWSAQTLLDTLASGSGWDTNRKIATTSGGSGVPFRVGNLTATQKSALGTTTAIQQSTLGYLRGDRSKEGASFRTRAHILGDIVHSKAVPVAVPNASFQEYANPGYAAFKASKASRKTMVYVGANDGMLHALNGETNLAKDANGGKEVWAYVPSFAISGPNGTPAVDGLAAYGATTLPYLHHFYVDQSPEVRDVDFSKTDGSASTTPSWRTLLVGGLGKGGKGYYALDVTDGATAANETAVANKVLWEFSDADMGYSFGRPAIVKTVKYGWVVLLTSGYNNVSGANAGQGFLYVVNARTGALIKKIGTNVGSAANPSGLARGTAYIQNFDDFTADQYYIGDLLGNLWRFDLRAADGNYPAPDKIAVLTDPSGKTQPITVAPKIEIARNKRDRWVFVGTGKNLASTDVTDTQQQTIYALLDGLKAQPALTTTLTRNAFTIVTDLAAGIPVAGTGWLYDLTGGNTTIGKEQITVDLDANGGVLVFDGNWAGGDPCVPGGMGRIYAVEFDTGHSVLNDGKGGVMSYVQGVAAVSTKLVAVNRKLSLVATDATGKTKPPPDGLRQPARSEPATVNWREIFE